VSFAEEISRGGKSGEEIGSELNIALSDAVGRVRKSVWACKL